MKAKLVSVLSFTIAFALAVWVFGWMGWIAVVLWSIYLAARAIGGRQAPAQAERYLRAERRRRERNG